MQQNITIFINQNQTGAASQREAAVLIKNKATIMQNSDMQALKASSYLGAGNIDYLEDLYEQYLKNPEQVAPEWRQYFANLPQVNGLAVQDISHDSIRQDLREAASKARRVEAAANLTTETGKQFAVTKLINAYRTFGHLHAEIDPLGTRRTRVYELDLSYYGLTPADDNQVFLSDGLIGKTAMPLKQIRERLENLYCTTIGAEYMHLNSQEEKRWLQEYYEHHREQKQLTRAEKMAILKALIAADGLEKYLGNKYVGQKRFSLEGGDSFVPLLRTLASEGARSSVKEIMIAMAHRGRLNTLINVMGQSPRELFDEFEGKKDYGLTSGDVKYHKGFSSDVQTPYGPMHLGLAFNPSHLEFVSAVIMGAIRSHQKRRNDLTGAEVLPVIVHGDASISGQGIVMETLNMSQTPAYRIGGSVHIVINNQIGFTVNPRDSRSSLYCTDIAKMIDAPVFHVNGDDPEAVVFIAQLALAYRQRFRKDIMIDLVCYRLHGHNEADEPSATQPLMYQTIRAHQAPREIYAEKLVKEGSVTQEEVNKMVEDYRQALDEGRQVVDLLSHGLADQYKANWTPYLDQNPRSQVNTAVDDATLRALGKKLVQLPEGFELQRQVGNMMQTRIKMAEGEVPMDWGFAENLAYATLVAQNYPVRMSGQDARRGTFSHRHAVFHDQRTGESYIPLNYISENQATFEIYDSLLSEAGAMGFEYGYAATDPLGLTIWEAQYGDFANGAQVIIDQFIVSGWQKWKSLCGVTLFLPHGYEGAGPEHSSARPERFLQLCAQGNIQVFVPTTPAQLFHMLRRQIIRPVRIPLVVMMPKNLLRHKLSVSTIDDLSRGQLQLVIPEIDEINKPAEIKRVVLCCGKVYYDLLSKRREENIKNIAIIRIEQLYPFPYEELKAILKPYEKVKDIVWCQEEPENQGAWYTTRHRLEKSLNANQKLSYVGREASAAPAAGYMKLHVAQQNKLVAEALQLA